MQFVPYLGFNGQCKEAFEFYEKCFGGKIVMTITYGETPMAGHTAPEEKDKIMHVRLLVGDQVLMGGDAPGQTASKPQGMAISIQIKDPSEAERVFDALSAGGQVQMPMGETFFAQRFGMLIDRYGIPWMVNCEAAAPGS